MTSWLGNRPSWNPWTHPELTPIFVPGKLLKGAQILWKISFSKPEHWSAAAPLILVEVKTTGAPTGPDFLFTFWCVPVNSDYCHISRGFCGGEIMRREKPLGISWQLEQHLVQIIMKASPMILVDTNFSIMVIFIRIMSILMSIMVILKSIMVIIWSSEPCHTLKMDFWRPGFDLASSQRESRIDPQSQCQPSVWPRCLLFVKLFWLINHEDEDDIEWWLFLKKHLIRPSFPPTCCLSHTNQKPPDLKRGWENAGQLFPLARFQHHWNNLR